MDIIDEELKARCGAADEINLGNLLTVIRDNKDTEYGKKYGFEDIKRVEDYRSRVPLTDYSDYEESIARMRNGEKNVYFGNDGSLKVHSREPHRTGTVFRLLRKMQE